MPATGAALTGASRLEKGLLMSARLDGSAGGNNAVAGTTRLIQTPERIVPAYHPADISMATAALITSSAMLTGGLEMKINNDGDGVRPLTFWRAYSQCGGMLIENSRADNLPAFQYLL